MFDCFSFFNELDLLEIRLNLLDPVVEKFVLVESNMTHAGKPKELLFQQNRSRFSKFLPKIYYILYNGSPENPHCNRWFNENQQRDAILEVLWHIKPSDGLLHISDLDEIPRPGKLVEAARVYESTHLPVSLQQINCLYYMNFQTTAVSLGSYVYDPTKFNEVPTMLRWHACDNTHKNDFPMVADAGWHFSTLGGVEKIREKLSAYAHKEFDDPEVISDQHLLECMKNGVPYYEKKFKFVENPLRFEKKDISNLPKYVQDNLETYGKYILKD